MGQSTVASRASRQANRARVKEHRRFDRQHLAELDRSIRTKRRDSERRKPEARWPYIVSALLFGIGFLPVVGWANVIAFPVLAPFWVVVGARSSLRGRAYNVALLFAFINAVLSLILQISYILGWG